MNTCAVKPDFGVAETLLSAAALEGRTALFEDEVYKLLASLCIGEPPAHAVINSPEGGIDAIAGITSEKIVLKILHPRIVHKTEAGAVRVVSRDRVGEIVRLMWDEVPSLAARAWMESGRVPQDLADCTESETADAIRGEIRGVLACEFIEAPVGFGRELLIGMRHTREFGPVLNVGLGGLGAEMYAKVMKLNRAGVTSSPLLSEPAEIFAGFRHTVPFRTLTGGERGFEAVVSEEALAEILARFAGLTAHFSSRNEDARFWISECEVNPFLFREGRPVPVDGLLGFRPSRHLTARPPIEKMKALLRPRNVCILGASAKGMNIGRIILRNLLQAKFPSNRLALIKEDAAEVDGVKCHPCVSALPEKFDLIVLAIPAPTVPAAVAEIVKAEKAESILLVTGGMGEKKGAEGLEDEVRRIILSSRESKDQGPVLVGGNSLGIISGPGNYDTLFIPETKLPKNLGLPVGRNMAIISQSGAFMISRMSKMGGFVPRYGLSVGNQVDLAMGDYIEHLAADREVRVFGCYIEAFKTGDGLKFARIARDLTEEGRDVIVYKVGRSREGRTAAGGHTAAIAGDWDVADAVLSKAGCIVARSFDEWSELLAMCALLGDRSVGRGRLGALSNAGYETVGMADHLKGELHGLTLAEFTEETRSLIYGLQRKFRLSELQDVRNPLDLTPMAVDRAHVEILKALALDSGVDVLIHGCVPLSAAMKTREAGGPEGAGIDDPESFTRLLIAAVRDEIKKPVAVVVDAGSLYDPMAQKLFAAGIPVFRSADDAVRTMGRWVRSRLSKPGA